MDTAIARPELLLVADAVAREKNIDREEVLEAMEQAIQKAGRAKYGHEKDIRATIDRKSGDVRLSRWTEIVEAVENEETQMGKSDAAKLFPDKKVGEFVVDPLPPIDFGRIAAQTAKQVIVQRVREYERKRQYDEFKDRVGEIINGVVKRTEYGNLMVELGRAEALLRRDELIARESFRNGDRVRATSTMCARNRAARRFSSHAPILASWRSCSRRRCRKSMTESSRSRRSRVIRGAAPRWR